jgi:hypothetical protein
MKLMLKFCTILLIVLICLPVSNAANKEKTVKYLGSNDFKKQLYNLGVYWDRKILNLQTDCQSQYQVKPVSFAFINPLAFGANQGHPISGVWTFRFEFVRCGESIVYNALSIAQKEGPPTIIPMVPGNTLSSPQLMQDLMLGVGVAMKIKYRSEKTCPNPKILNTELTMNQQTIEKNGRKLEGVWEEKWTALYCDVVEEVTFCLIPDGKGGTNWSVGKCTK